MNGGVVPPPSSVDRVDATRATRSVGRGGIDDDAWFVRARRDEGGGAGEETTGRKGEEIISPRERTPR